MADAVSKLYAEIGFRVNQDGLKQLQSILKGFASEMDKINKATKETAKSFGIFSKEKAKEAIADEKLAREQLKSERERIKNKMVIRNQEFKEEMAIRKATHGEKLKEDRENERLARQEQRRNDRVNRERKRALKDALHSTGEFVKGIGRHLKAAALGFSRLLYSGVNESLGRSVATRDFMMMTGAELGDIQSVMGRFASVGHLVPQETIMGDLIKLSQNIADIALGNNDAATFKLLGQAAERGDIAGMLRGIGRAGKYIDNDMFTRLIGNIGLPSYWLSFFKGQGGGKEITNFIDKEGNKRIVEARSALATLTISFKNLADWLTATLSPTLVEISVGLQDWVQDMSESLKGETGQRLSENLKKLGEALIEFVKRFEAEKVTSVVASFVGALEYLAGKVVWLAKKFGYVPESEKEQYMKDFSAKIRGRMMSGDIQDWLINREAIKIGYKPTGSGGVNIIDNRSIVSTVNVKDEEVVDAVQDAIQFGDSAIDRSVVNAFVSGKVGG